MKTPYLILLIVIVTGSTVIAQDSASPREQLKQYVADLQKSPDDQTLREKIIKLALTLDPKPATPEDAERFMARGQAALEIAKESKGYAESIAEFQKAALAAPWLGNVYYNLGFVQEKAGDYAAALRNLKLYLLATPNASDEKEVKALIYKIEYKQEQVVKEASPEAVAEREKQKEQEFIKSLDGARFTRKSELRSDTGELWYASIDSVIITGNKFVDGYTGTFDSTGNPSNRASIGQWRVSTKGTIEGRKFKARYGPDFKVFVISEDGESMEHYIEDSNGNRYSGSTTIVYHRQH